MRGRGDRGRRREQHVRSGTSVITVNKHGLPTRHPHVTREYASHESLDAASISQVEMLAAM